MRERKAENKSQHRASDQSQLFLSGIANEVEYLTNFVRLYSLTENEMYRGI